MKRINHLYSKICSLENLQLADKRARRGKSKYKEIKDFDKNKENKLLELQNRLINCEFKTSKYHIFKIKEDKERIIHKLPYYPDRIVHHAIMNILEPIFVKCFTANTYSCIKNRGVHKLLYKLRSNLKNIEDTKYCLKIDIKKFYPSVDNLILKSLLERKFKDKKLLNLLYEIISSADGLPLGNYLSQFLANFYLTYFDHWIKEVLKIKYVYRYCDDIVILHSNKDYLHNIRKEIQKYLWDNLKLDLKSNYQVFLISKRGIDYIGYKSFHRYTLLRKKIKKNFIKMIKHNKNDKSIASYNGWLSHCNSINLKRKYL